MNPASRRFCASSPRSIAAFASLPRACRWLTWAIAKEDPLRVATWNTSPAILVRGSSGLLGVEGPEAELRRASDEFSGHCLALTFLGSYLTDAFNGDIRCRDEVSSRLGSRRAPRGACAESDDFLRSLVSGRSGAGGAAFVRII